jgi:hypothetical protein
MQHCIRSYNGWNRYGHSFSGTVPQLVVLQEYQVQPAAQFNLAVGLMAAATLIAENATEAAGSQWTIMNQYSNKTWKQMEYFGQLGSNLFPVPVFLSES